jgi:hypothetical protein
MLTNITTDAKASKSLLIKDGTKQIENNCDALSSLAVGRKCIIYYFEVKQSSE